MARRTRSNGAQRHIRNSHAAALCALVCLCACSASVLAMPFDGPRPRSDAAEEELATLSSVRMVPTVRLRSRLQRMLQNRQASVRAAKCKGGEGLTLASCKFHDDCKDPHLCVGADFKNSCSGRTGCFCLREKTQLCEPCEKCLGSGLVCAIDPTDPSDSGLCASCTTVAEGILAELPCDPDGSPGPDEDEGESSPDLESSGGSEGPNNVPTVGSDDDDDGPESSGEPASAKSGSSGDGACIDARLMQHLPSSQRVYTRHRRAHVLCDASESCATPGHMVVYLRSPMMMKEYCHQVSKGCVEQTMLVNSPRFGTRLRVASRSPDLEFTAFAARFESRAERHVLAMAIRAGI